MAKGSDNKFPKVILTEQGSTPANADSGDQKLFIDSADHHLKRVNSGGSVTDIEGAGGGVTRSGSTTDNHLAVWNGSDADSLKDGGTGGGGGNSTESVAVGSETLTTEGDLNFATDGPVVERYDGTAWQTWGPIFKLIKPLPLLGATTTLNNSGTMGSGDASCTVTDGSVLGTAPFLIRIGTEDILVGARSTNSLTSLTRGYNGTSAASHTDGSTVTLVNWEWVNQGGATISTTGGVLTLSAPAGASNSRLLKRLAPATPYTVTALVSLALPYTNWFGAGLLWRQSSDGKLIYFGIQNDSANNFASFKAAGATSAVAAVYTPNWAAGVQGPLLQVSSPFVWLRINDTGVNRVCSMSYDNLYYTTIHTVGRTDYATGDEIGFGVLVESGSIGAGMSVLSWSVT